MQDKDFLSYFDNLGHAPNEAQIKENAEKILTTLLTVEHQNVDKTDEFNSQLGQLVSEDLEYTVSRLIQGAISDDYQNKLGFVTPLIGVLKTFKHIQPDKYIAFTDKVTDRGNAITKGERSHYLASRLASLYCLVASGRIDQLPNSLDVYTNLYNSCILNTKEMSWCGQLVLRLIEKSIDVAADSKVALKRVNLITKLFKSQLKSIVADFQLDNFGLLLYVARKQVELGGEKQGTLHDAISDVITNPKMVAKMFQTLMNIYPEKHICLRYLAEYLTRVKSVKEQNAFWQIVSTILKEKEIVGKDKKPLHHLYFNVLQLFKYWVKDPQLSGKAFVKVIETEVFQIWMKELKVLNKIVRNVAHRIEEHMSKKIIELLKESGAMTSTEFLSKIKETKEYMFDSKNPLAKALLGGLSEEEALQYVNKIIEGFKQEKETYQIYMNELQAIFDLNYKNISDKTVLRICQFLLETYLTFEFQGETQGNEEEGISPEDARKAITNGVREEAFNKLSSFIARLLKKPNEAFQGRKSTLWLGISKNGEVWTYRILKLLMKLAKDCNLPYLETIKSANKCIEEIQAEIQEDMSGKEEAKEGDKADQGKTRKFFVLTLMISATALQLLNFPDLDESVEELIECTRKIKERFDAEEEGDVLRKKRRTGKKKEKKITKDQENKPVDVLTDIMVSLLTRCPSYLREAIERTFEQFVDEIDDFSLENLVGVVTRDDQEYFADMKDDEAQDNLPPNLEEVSDNEFENGEEDDEMNGEDAE